MIGWVNEACKAWGRAQYWVLYGYNGWPSRTLLGKMIDEGIVGAAVGQWVREFPEVLTGQNLLTANAVKRLGEESRTLVTVHYVIKGHARHKCRVIHMAPRTYYAKLDAVHYQLAILIDQVGPVAHNSHYVCAQIDAG
jgi:hypothetical protein